MLMERLHRTAAAIFLATAVPWLLFGSVYSFQESHSRKIGRSSDHRAENQFHNEQNGIWGHSDPGVTLVTTLLVLVGSVQVGLFLAQLRLIRESLEPAKEAANAANLNAQAVIDAERAYIFGGGPASGSDPKYVHGAIENDGRTPGFLKRVDWGICDEAIFPKDVPVSRIIEHGLLPKEAIEKIEIEDVYPPTPKGQPYYRIKFEFLPNIGKIFFGRFVYHDVFGKKHYSTFKLKLHKERGSDPLPGCYSDWS